MGSLEGQAAPASSLEQYRAALDLSLSVLDAVATDFREQLEASLSRQGTLLCLPTMVDVLPQGHEHGEFYAVVIGGTRLELLYLKLPRRLREVTQLERFQENIPTERKHGTTAELFDYAARAMLTWSAGKSWDVAQRKDVTLALSFTFPLDHTSMTSGTLIRWTKGFSCEGGVGHDPAVFLTEAFARQGVGVRCAALVNDTVATLAAARYLHGADACIGVVMGTGTNCCYVEQLGAIQKWLPRLKPRTPEMVVNIEWPGFASDAVPALAEDEALDAASRAPGAQRFEKLTAGLYLGEVVRQALLSLVGRGELFGGRAPPAPGEPCHAFTARHVAAAVHDATPNLGATGAALQQALGYAPAATSLADRQLVRELCVLVTRRSARLIAAAIVGLIRHLGRDRRLTRTSSDGGVGEFPHTVVAVDGGIFTEYPLYEELVQEGVRELLGPGAGARGEAHLGDLEGSFLAELFLASDQGRFSLQTVRGGSAFGAACIAAAATGYLNFGRASATFGATKFPSFGSPSAAALWHHRATM